jgi:hypothetical protein
LLAGTSWVMQYYRICVRLRSGGQATGRDLHTGLPPDHSTGLSVLLVTGRTVNARIGPFHRKESTKKGVKSSVTEVYADEI